MSKMGIMLRFIIVILFLASLYFVEAGFCGSTIVAKYNNGFGTLDMKNYNVEMVKRALEPMNEKGINIYKNYYMMDFIFIIFFGLFQIMVISDVFSFFKCNLGTMIMIAVPILRGICDMIENIILLRTIYTYPQVNEVAIQISSKFTAIKFVCIKVWLMLIIIGLIWKLILYLKG